MRRVGRAPHAQLEKIPEHRAGRLLILRLLLPALLRGAPGPVDEALLLAAVDRAPARGELHEEHAVAVHVALRRGAPRLRVLRRHVPDRAGHHRAHVGVAGADHPGQPEVRHLGAPVAVQEHVAGLHVAVHHGGHALVVQERQRPRHAHGRVQPRRPPERRRVADQRLQAPAVEPLVDQYLGAAGEAPPIERDEVRVRPREPHPVGEHLHLGAELALAVAVHAVARPGELLHRHGAAVGERAAVHHAGAAAPDHPVVGEVARGSQDVAVGERRLVQPEHLHSLRRGGAPRGRRRAGRRRRGHSERALALGVLAREWVRLRLLVHREPGA
uniref:Uncharacterized protein n=1 Tax=Triticum urartu TaxID=4572 RepID=A0A8R7TF96_TRIUA